MPGLAEVQEEAIAFGRSVLKHRFLLGIEDISLCAVRISNELGRVLAIVPLHRVKRMRSSTQHLPLHCRSGRKRLGRGRQGLPQPFSQFRLPVRLVEDHRALRQPAAFGERLQGIA